MNILLLVLIALTLQQPALSYTVKSRSIRDLEHTGAYFFAETNPWTFYKTQPSSKYITCAGTNMLTGDAYSVIRLYESLPAHNSIYLQFKLMMIDRWSDDDKLKIEIGAENYITDRFEIGADYNETNYVEKSCGNNKEYDLSVTVLFKISHSGSTLKIGFTRSVLTSANFAIRDINILLSTDTVSTSTMCGISSPENLLYPVDLNCACPFGKYWDTTANECLACNSACATCFGPSSNQCYSCSRSYTYNGNSCVSCLSYGYNECTRCASGYLHSDLSCRSTCTSPASYSHYWNSYYLYCIPYCSPPQYYSTEYRTCINQCDYPLIKKFEGSTATCSSPCAGSSSSFIMPDRTCSSTCHAPYKESNVGSFKTCVYASKSDLIENAQVIIAFTSQFTMSGLQASNAISAGSPGGLSVGIIQKMFSYIKFINIPYSPELEEALATWKTSFISFEFAPELPEDIQDEELDQQIPPVFVKHEVSSNFLLNFWDSLFSILVISALFGLTLVLEWVSLKIKKKFLPHYVCHTLKIVAQNYLLTEVYGNFGDILLYAILQFYAISTDTATTIISVCLAVIFLLVTIVGLYLHLNFILIYKRVKKEADKMQDPDALEAFKEKYEGFQMLFRDFKDETLAQQLFLLVFCLRDLAFSFVLTILTDYPTAQIILVVLFGALMLFYLLAVRPFDDVVDQVQQILCEMVILVMNGSILVSVIATNLDPEVFDVREPVGKIITLLNVSFGFLALAFVGIKFYFIVKGTYRTVKLCLKRKMKERRIKARMNHLALTQRKGLKLSPSIDRRSQFLKKLDQTVKKDEKTETKAKKQLNTSEAQNLGKLSKDVSLLMEDL